MTTVFIQICCLHLTVEVILLSQERGTMKGGPDERQDRANPSSEAPSSAGTSRPSREPGAPPDAERTTAAGSGLAARGRRLRVNRTALRAGVLPRRRRDGGRHDRDQDAQPLATHQDRAGEE